MDGVTVTLPDLAALDRESQIQAMRSWFYERFEDPAERTPYESREGGYLWIWGGPFDAREELESQFSGHVPDDVITELVEELEGECWQWAPVSKPEDYDDFDDYFVDDVVAIEDCHNEFIRAVTDIRSLLSIDAPMDVTAKLHSLIFVNAITALETYLSDKFIKRVMSDDEALRRCVESSPAFANEKISISEVFKAAESIKSHTKTYLADIVWHNLGRIKPMFGAVLQVDLGDIGPIMTGVTKRHDLVHRNGRDKDGNPVIVTVADIRQLLASTETLVGHIETQLTEAF